jgi:hypothetical protein
MPEVTNLRAGVYSMINSRSGAMKLSYLYPLFGFILPTAIVGYGFVIPKSCIAGINDLTIGYTVTLISARASPTGSDSETHCVTLPLLRAASMNHPRSESE